MSNPAPPGYRPWPHRAALLAAAATWPLLFVGGLVTTFRVGMAVPDWPTTFGINMFVYDFFNSSKGVFLEHSHRLLGAAAGLCCIALAVGFTAPGGRRAWGAVGAGLGVGAVGAGLAMLATEGTSPLLIAIAAMAAASLLLAAWFAAFERRWLPAMGWLALGAVIGQGVLGGLRVRWNSTDLAAVHGCTGQAFFALLVASCVLTGRKWASAADPSAVPPRVRWLAMGAAAATFGQIVAGAWLRHYRFGLATHATAAVLVVALVVACAIAVHRGHRRWPSLTSSARASAILVGVQVALGVGSWWLLRPFDGFPRSVEASEALIRTAHQANGALLLAATVALATRAWRPRPGAVVATTRPEVAAQRMETVPS